MVGAQWRRFDWSYDRMALVVANTKSLRAPVSFALLIYEAPSILQVSVHKATKAWWMGHVQGLIPAPRAPGAAVGFWHFVKF